MQALPKSLPELLLSLLVGHAYDSNAMRTRNRQNRLDNPLL